MVEGLGFSASNVFGVVICCWLGTALQHSLILHSSQYCILKKGACPKL